MAETTDIPLNATARGPRRWWLQARELFASRYALAELEVRSDIDVGRRFGIVGGMGLVMALTGLPLLAIVLAAALASATGTAIIWWQLGLGVAFLLVGLAIFWLSLRTFRREFAGLRETLEELREDAAWMRELAEEFAPYFAPPASDGDEAE